MTKIFHNPRCSKSRETLKIIENKEERIEIIKYLENPPSKKELKEIISLLNIKPIELVRIQEKEWKENFKNQTLSDEEIIDAMIKFPRLIERPIVVKNDKAIIGRPPENVLKIL